MDVERTDEAVDDMAALDKSIARGVKQAVERFSRTGSGDIKRLRVFIHPNFGCP